MLNELREDKLKRPDVYYYTGGSGKGKTKTALLEAIKKYSNEEILMITFNNNFGQIRGGNTINPKCLIIDELRASDIKPAMFL